MPVQMIEGFATADATGAHAKRFDALSYTTLSRMELCCSQEGFGCYRIADGIDSHQNALQRALDGGINLIDTSANYANGESETLVGKVLTEAIESAAYEGRILKAFQHLEREVARGRIRYYGISSNTFPEPSDRPDFTCLQRILDVASTVGPEHHFALIQFPMNLIESGAVLNRNQPDGTTVLTTAMRAGLGTLVNRPLNALAADGLLRLSDVRLPRRYPPEEIVQAIQSLVTSENMLAREKLPNLDLSEELHTRIVTQIQIGPMLLQQHQAFPSYEHWRQIMTSQLLPRVNDVLAYLDQQAFRDNLCTWAEVHARYLTTVLEAVTSLYAPAAAERAEALKQMVQQGDPNWEGHGTLSQMALRVLRTTHGISSVLVGMRHPGYVADVLQELHRLKPTKPNETAWAHIKGRLSEFGLS